MSNVYTKLADTKPIRPDDVAVSGCTYAAIEVRDNTATSDSAKYDFPIQRIDYYYGKDDDNLKAVVGKTIIDASDSFIAASKIKYIQTTKTFAVNGTDTVTYDGETYTWTATGTTAGAGAWTDSNDNPTTFELTFLDEILDAIIIINGVSYGANYLWLRDLVPSMTANEYIPNPMGSDPRVGEIAAMSDLDANLKRLYYGGIDSLMGSKLKTKPASLSAIETEGSEFKIVIIDPDGDGDHEGKEVMFTLTVFQSNTGKWDAIVKCVEATSDYEFAQALDAMNTGDEINMSTYHIS